MSAPDIPTDYHITTDMRGPGGGPVAVNMTTTALGPGGGPVAINMTTGGGDKPVTLKMDPMEMTTTMLGDPNKPVATKADVTMEITNIPKLTLQNMFDLIAALKRPNMRMTMPMEMNFGISVFPLTLLGLDAVKFSICGQQQVIMDEYRPNIYERCAADCTPDPAPCKEC